MKAKVLVDLLKSGKKPLVRLTGVLFDDSFGQNGMIARVMSVTHEPHDLLQLDFDFNENREHNLSLDEPNWFLGSTDQKGTVLEANHFDDPNNLHEEIFFEEDQDIPVELVSAGTPLSSYMDSGSKLTYVEWLEAKLEELVPDCMKDWKPII